MATSAFPAVVDALIALSAAAMPTVAVVEGINPSRDPGSFLMVNVDAGDVDGAPSPRIEQSRATMSGARNEQGVVVCAAESWNGDGNPKAARDAAFAVVAGVENLLRSTPTLGLSVVLKTEFGEDIYPRPGQGDFGAECFVIFSVAYLARI
jgi:hypothetical protein